MSTARIGILTVSDRASRGEYEDRSGPAIRDYLSEVLTSSWEPVAIVIPCHRVVGANGRLTGYAGGIATKRRLLQHEGALLV